MSKPATIGTQMQNFFFSTRQWIRLFVRRLFCSSNSFLVRDASVVRLGYRKAISAASEVRQIYRKSSFPLGHLVVIFVLAVVIAVVVVLYVFVIILKTPKGYTIDNFP